ncbi:Phosphate-binding protein PstS OS=Rhodanobacter lindaniclasticus OX=75310 GN=B1991_01280 PE=3 SV=1 [Rhodanobacter lindaniclasticus]
MAGSHPTSLERSFHVDPAQTARPTRRRRRRRRGLDLRRGRPATDITGAGSSFVYPVMSKWSAAYAEKTGHRLNYQSVGSGAGIAQIKEGTIDFGASDAPMKAEDLQKYGLGQFPIVVGGIVPVVNIAGVQAGQIDWVGATLADIFLGKIRNWNDPKIAALNAGLTLPAGKITVVHRSDGSGTSFNFTNYLSKVSPEWASQVKFGTAVEWPTGVGGKGNEGVSQYVKQIKGSIGYVEYAYAVKNRISWVDLKTRRRPRRCADRGQLRRRRRDSRLGQRQGLQPHHDQRAGRAGVADHRHHLDHHVQDTKNAGNGKLDFDFFKSALEQGQQAASELDYVPLPTSLVGQVEAYWAAEFKH